MRTLTCGVGIGHVVENQNIFILDGKILCELGAEYSHIKIAFW